MKKWLFWLLPLAITTLAIVVILSRPKNLTVQDSNNTAADDLKTLYGVSWSPKSSSVSDLTSFFEQVGSLGGVLSWAGPYADLAKTTGNATKTVLEQSKKHQLTPVIIVGPADNEVFDGVFRQSFRENVIKFVTENEVPYLGLGNEIDEIYLSSPARFEAFLATAEGLADEVRTVSPQTKVFTTFQLERIKGLQGGLFGKSNDPKNNLWGIVTAADKFDFIAFTTYPCLIFKNSSDIPNEYYSDIQNHLTKPVIFTEIGWFRETPVTGWESSETEQAEFIRRFDELTTRLKPKIVIWPFLYDQAIQAPFQHMGLLGVNQTDSAALQAWKTLGKN